MNNLNENTTEDEVTTAPVPSKALFQILLQFLHFAIKKRESIFDNQVEIYNKFVR